MQVYPQPMQKWQVKTKNLISRRESRSVEIVGRRRNVYGFFIMKEK
jgi:hypothetical protein